MRSSLLYFSMLVLNLFPLRSALAERNYGIAGCGIGSTVVKKDGPQSVAAVINVTAPYVSAATLGFMIAGGQPLAVALVESGGMQAAVTAAMVIPHPATAMSLGTSNCKPDAIEQAMTSEQERFMFANYANLSKEVAQGAGTNLNTLFELLGCKTSDQESLRKIAQAEHERIFAAPGAVAALDTLRETLAKNSAAAQGCTNIAVSPTKGATR